MSSFSPQFLDELRARVSLEDVVGKRVRLIRRGREYVGLSPFQKEKTPSFTVVPDKGFYHDFSSGEHGDVIDFVMKVEGLTFPEAVERLAAEAGMEIPADSPEEREKDRERQTLYEVMEAASGYFQKMLKMPEGKTALAYLRGRGLSDATIERFRLGFAPDQRNGIKAALAREGIPEDLMRAAGVIRRPDDGRPDFDYFRRRVMFPITDRRGRIVAFGGRILGDGEPKYLNSPESALFQKRHVLYGLTQALKPARDKGRILVTEGYMDVISLHQAGFDFAVAPLGTALTEDQLQVLWKIVHEPVLCFDGDTAGQKAALRVAEHALPQLKPGYSLRFAVMTGGEDPDSLIKTRGAAAMAEVLADTRPLSEILWRMETGGGPAKTPEERAALEGRLQQHALKIQDPTVRSHFLNFFRDRVRERMRSGPGSGPKGGPRKGRGGPYKPAPEPVTTNPGRRFDRLFRIQQQLLAVVINHPALFESVGERLGGMAFADSKLDGLRQKTVEILAERATLTRDVVVSALQEAGLAGDLSALLDDPLIKASRNIRETATDEAARDIWLENESILHGAALAADASRVPGALEKDFTDTSWKKAKPVIAAKIGEDGE